MSAESAAAVERRAPGPAMLGTLWRMAGPRMLGGSIDKLHGVSALFEEYGDAVRIHVGPRCMYLFRHPDQVQEILVTRHKDLHKSDAYFALRLVLGQGLVTSEEDFHLRQRRMIQPGFHRERVRGYAQCMIDRSLQFRDALEPGQALDINRAMNRLALLIVGETLFGADVSGATERVADALDTLMGMDEIFINPLGPLIARLPLPINTRRKAATAVLDEVLYAIIADHRARGTSDDMLGMLLAARDEDDGGQMTDLQVRDEAITLFLAGHETTANALTWTWMLLAQHPECEARLHAELDAVLGGRPPGPDDYPRLDYTRRVLAESMRLYPPVWSIARAAIRDTTIGGYAVPKGSQIAVSQWATQRDPRFFPDPLRFDPDRWLPEAAEGRHKFAYFPFGGGRRLCIGEPFAWMEGVLVIATLAQRWRFTLAPGFVPHLDPHITLRPKHGLEMTAAPREH